MVRYSMEHLIFIWGRKKKKMALKEKTGKKGNWFGSPTPCLQTPSTHESKCEIEVLPEEQDFLHEIMHDESKEEKKFITSPADIDTYRETKLKDAELSE